MFCPCQSTNAFHQQQQHLGGSVIRSLNLASALYFVSNFSPTQTSQSSACRVVQRGGGDGGGEPANHHPLRARRGGDELPRVLPAQHDLQHQHAAVRRLEGVEGVPQTYQIQTVQIYEGFCNSSLDSLLLIKYYTFWFIAYFPRKH